jgi:hypothetical protein
MTGKDEQVIEALRWAATNRPGRGADAVFGDAAAAAESDAVVPLATTRAARPLVLRAAAILTVVVVLGGLVLLAPGRTLRVGDEGPVGSVPGRTGGTAPAPAGCRVDEPCTMPDRPESVHVPPSALHYSLELLDLVHTGNPAAPPDAVGPFATYISRSGTGYLSGEGWGRAYLWLGFVPADGSPMDQTIGNRRARIIETPPEGVTLPGGPLSMRVDIEVRLTDRLNLVVMSFGPAQHELLPVIEAIEVR